VSDDARWPDVAVVVPVRNEADHLESAVAAITTQDYPGALGVWLAVAPSTDGTEELAAKVAATDPRVHVVANPSGSTGAGLNAAIRASSGDVIVRVDGHAELCAGYIRRAVETMSRTGAVNVGGVQQAVGETPFEEAVALAITSRFGTGGSRFRVGGEEGPVDTVYLGVFRRAAIEAVGLFDDSLIRNQDYELNIRLRDAGGVVWFDPELSVTYRPRGTLASLARQYLEYGQWKAQVWRRHPGSLRLRQAAPPLVTSAVVVTTLLAPRRPVAAIVPAGYVVALGAATALAARTRFERWPAVAAALATIHWTWSAGFLAGLTRRRS
jgi:succinoglycan biosynthesis protein ExoA